MIGSPAVSATEFNTPLTTVGASDGLFVPEVRRTGAEELAVTDDATPFPLIHNRVLCGPSKG